MRRRNALLAKPPRGVHGLDAAGGQFFRSATGRRPTREEYEGVHTTTSKELAAIYAMGATRASDDDDAYPVIIVLDVSGLKAVPDVDAMAMAAHLLGAKWMRKQYEGYSLDEASDFDRQIEYGAGSDTEASIMDELTAGQVVDAFGGDDEAWDHWVATGEYSDEIAIDLVKQKRYLSDVGYDRLVRIDAMKPWWPELLEDYDYGEEAEEAIERVEAAGFKAITVEDAMRIDVLELREVAKGPAKDRDVEYHGTSSTSAQLAFPEITLPPNPFPVTDVEENPRRAYERRLAKKLKV